MFEVIQYDESVNDNDVSNVRQTKHNRIKRLGVNKGTQTVIVPSDKSNTDHYHKECLFKVPGAFEVLGVGWGCGLLVLTFYN